jgi:hypothetical protein
MSAAEESAPASEAYVAIDKLRESARWLILAFAAIGVALAGSAPLSNLGKLEIDDWRLWVAVGAAAVGLGAIAAAIWAAVNVAEPITRDLATLVKDRELAALFAANWELLRGHGRSLAAFKKEYDGAREGYREALQRLEEERTDKNVQDEAEKKKRFFQLAPIVARITEEGLLIAARRKYRRALRAMFAAALVAGFAIVAFTWASNPAEAKPAKEKAKPAKEKAKASLASIERAGVAAHGAGITISRKNAVALLKATGVKAPRAEDFVDSFDGPIEIETVRDGEHFRRYSAVPSGSGPFLTNARFIRASDARLALHLPWSNSARCLQLVVAKRRTLVLEGEISQGKPKVRQILVLAPHAFSYRRGRGYGDARCPR